MASEMIVNFGQLQELVNEVQKTKKTHTVQLADGVVAVVKPDEQPAPSRSEGQVRKHTPSRRKAAKNYTLESAYGAVADSDGPRDFDQMIREAKDERADRLLPSSILKTRSRLPRWSKQSRQQSSAYDGDFDKVPGIAREEP